MATRVSGAAILKLKLNLIVPVSPLQLSAGLVWGRREAYFVDSTYSLCLSTIFTFPMAEKDVSMKR
jgi:hypothetical protein